MGRRVNVVPHTHWDREWYLPFEEFRDQLVETLDLVLHLLAQDERWTHFHLDGQVAMITDYLAVRPERRDELRTHVISGRLSCGPWVTLADEFSVSGESIVRNLEDGLAQAETLGGAMRVGYLPDQFGHIGQMPQILRNAGIERAVTWRGVPAVISGSGFTWRAPDGSAVATLYLPYGYGHGRKLTRRPEVFGEAVRREIDRLDPYLARDGSVLVMAGGDHTRPDPRLPDLIEAEADRGTDIRVSSLEQHLADWTVPEMSWVGELRSAARANLLPNTYSVRPQQKLARARAEHRLERYAEPLAALVPGETWPAEELNRAWSLLHVNSAHDSVCGCSTDDVARAVDGRTDEVLRIANAIAETALQRLATGVHDAGPLIFNPSPFEREGVPGLGWSVAPTRPESAPLQIRKGADGLLVPVGEGEVALWIEDQPDSGDLYTFCPAGGERRAASIEVSDGIARLHFDGFDALVRAWPTPTLTQVDVDIDNRSPDHRIRIALQLPEVGDTTRAGSPFEIVVRPRMGEGGSSEPPSPTWPARGFVVAGNAGFLAEGVFEYEHRADGTLLMTLMRCVGTISRAKLATRAVEAGPHVPTPDAQLIGRHRFTLGVVMPDPGDAVIDTWESFALPLMAARCPGGGRLPRVGRLIEIDVPALSALRVVHARREVRVWNPWDRSVDCDVAGRALTLGPHRIETIRLGR